MKSFERLAAALGQRFKNALSDRLDARASGGQRGSSSRQEQEMAQTLIRIMSAPKDILIAGLSRSVPRPLRVAGTLNCATK